MSGNPAPGEPLFIVQKKTREGVQKGSRPDITGREFEDERKPTIVRAAFHCPEKTREGVQKGSRPDITGREFENERKPSIGRTAFLFPQINHGTAAGRSIPA